MTGVDRKKFLLDKARSRARASTTRIEWVQMEIRDFVRADAFDLVLNTFTSLGYLDHKEDDLQVLHNMLTSLKPGGVCRVDLIGKETLAKIFQATTSELLATGARLFQRQEVFDDWTRVRNEWILVRSWDRRRGGGGGGADRPWDVPRSESKAP